jgi:DNA-binding NtrC family response regulator
MAHILVVDDEPDVLRLMTRLLGRSEGVRVSTARRAATARAVLMSESVDLMITDARMPGESGVALIRVADELGVPALVISGDTDWALAKGVPPDRLIAKPFKLAALEAAAFRLLVAARPPATPSCRNDGASRSWPAISDWKITR